jgi:hypothetical protein
MMTPETLGFVACLDGKTFFDNPFPENTNEFRKWVDGYCHAISGTHLSINYQRISHEF